MKQELLRVPSVAQWLGVSKKRVYAMIQEGKLDAIRLGPRQTRIPRASVESLIERLARLHHETRGLDPEERREIEKREFACP
jgi:excisionase family DNA binding protein